MSPCILPLLPGYISFISGKTVEEIKSGAIGVRKTAVIGAVAFGLGFTIVFVLLGMSATSIGQGLEKYKDVLAKVAGVIIIIFGLNMIGTFRIKMLTKQVKFNYNNKLRIPYYIKSFLLGIAFMLGWTPCVGPILSAILVLAARGDSVYYGAKLLFIYSLGLWIPFLITAVLVNKVLTFTKKMSRYLIWIERVSGILLITIGILLLTDKMTLITSYMFKIFPDMY